MRRRSPSADYPLPSFSFSLTPGQLSVLAESRIICDEPVGCQKSPMRADLGVPGVRGGISPGSDVGGSWWCGRSCTWPCGASESWSCSAFEPAIRPVSRVVHTWEELAAIAAHVEERSVGHFRRIDDGRLQRRHPCRECQGSRLQGPSTTIGPRTGEVEEFYFDMFTTTVI